MRRTDPAASTADNLLREWNRRGLFRPAIRDDDISRLDRLVAINDSTATLEHRVRSYLDSNCAQCHRPGGSRAEFDARFDTPLDRQRLVNGRVMSSSMGIDGTKLIVPGDPDRSMIYLRTEAAAGRLQHAAAGDPSRRPGGRRGAGRMDPDPGGGTGRPYTLPPHPRSSRGGSTNSPPSSSSTWIASQVAGAVALVLQRGKPVFAPRPSDWPTRRSIGPMADDTIFRIASMTKPVTSVAILMLAEDGKLNLTDPVSKYLPEFKDMRVLDPKGTGSVPATRAITIHDLLTHTSGLTYGFLAGDRLGPLYKQAKISDGLAPTDATLEENVRRLAGLPLKHQPGSAWEYSLSADVLGRLVEVISGKSLDEFFRDRIFRPLGMNDTSFTVPSEKLSRLATLYGPGIDKTIETVRDDPVAGGHADVFAEPRVSREGLFLRRRRALSQPPPTTPGSFKCS